MILTEAQVKKILPTNKNISEWTKLLNIYLPKYKIDTKDRVAMFLAQCSHESREFTVLKENLNYSKDGLLKTFKTHFNEADAIAYARQPERIANRVYANRMGNGNEESGDGWKYRGKGLIQLTGHDNTLAFSLYIKKSIDDTCKYLLTNEGALESACYFWTIHKINVCADNEDVLGATKLVNGGTNGLLLRIQAYTTISTII
jgi:putative chitinase